MPLDQRISDAQEASRKMEQTLRSGERLLWSGKPRTGLQFESKDLLITAFMIFWFGGVVYWNIRAWEDDAHPFFRLWGVPFLVVGFYGLVGRFLGDAWERRRTFYGVTSERVIVTTEFLSRRTRSRQLDTLPDVSLDEREDGCGTIDFGEMEPDDRRSGLSFRLLDNCREVCDIVVQARSRAQERRT